MAQSQPLRRVSVSIQAGELDVPHIGVTDDEGRVVFRDLAAGNYLLTASRPGYVRTFYGSPLPGRGPGVAVTVLDGQRVTGVRIRMLRGSVITGVVRNANGRPAPNQSVQAIMVRSSGGEKRAINLEAIAGWGRPRTTAACIASSVSRPATTSCRCRRSVWRRRTCAW